MRGKRGATEPGQRDTNEARRQRMRKGQTPPKSELRQAKNSAFATLPHGAETAPSKPLKETVMDRSRWAKNVAQPNLDKDKNEARRQRMRKGQTPPKSELRQAKNSAFATLAHGAETAPSKPLKETSKGPQ